MIHIKPTADKANVLQFKANFLNFFKAVRDKKDGSPVDALTFNIKSESDGVTSTAITISAEIKSIVDKHAGAARRELETYLESVQRQLGL